MTLVHTSNFINLYVIEELLFTGHSDPLVIIFIYVQSCFIMNISLISFCRFLVKSVRQAFKGAKLTPFMSYLLLNQHERCRASKPEDFMNMETLLQAYKHRARR